MRGISQSFFNYSLKKIAKDDVRTKKGQIICLKGKIQTKLSEKTVEKILSFLEENPDKINNNNKKSIKEIEKKLLNYTEANKAGEIKNRIKNVVSKKLLAPSNKKRTGTKACYL